jgi:hypothetical protein
VSAVAAILRLSRSNIADAFLVTVSQRWTLARRPIYTRCRRRSTARCSGPLRRATGWRRRPRLQRRRSRYASLRAPKQLLLRRRRRHGRRRHHNRDLYRPRRIGRLNSPDLLSSANVHSCSISALIIVPYLASFVLLLRIYSVSIVEITLVTVVMCPSLLGIYAYFLQAALNPQADCACPQQYRHEVPRERRAQHARTDQDRSRRGRRTRLDRLLLGIGRATRNLRGDCHMMARIPPVLSPLNRDNIRCPISKAGFETMLNSIIDTA